MLEPAILHKEEITRKDISTWYDDRYLFYYASDSRESITVDEHDWNRRQFASVNSSGEVIGYISYGIERDANFAHGLGAINFELGKNGLIFIRDVLKAIDDIFKKYRHNKLDFDCVAGSPLERRYDKLTARCGGRIVGTYKENYKLMNGKMYDRKAYEIMRADYIKSLPSAKTGFKEESQ